MSVIDEVLQASRLRTRQGGLNWCSTGLLEHLIRLGLIQVPTHPVWSLKYASDEQGPARRRRHSASMFKQGRPSCWTCRGRIFSQATALCGRSVRLTVLTTALTTRALRAGATARWAGVPRRHTRGSVGLLAR
jgi:hypothetical protein